METTWIAFFDLKDDRSVGFGIGGIPFMALHFHAERAGIVDPDDFERFVRLIRAMDAVYIEDITSRMKEK